MEMNDDDLHHYSPSRRFRALSWLIVDSCRLLMISPCCVLQKDAFCCVFTQFMAHFPSYPCPSNHKGCISVRREEKGGKAGPSAFLSSWHLNISPVTQPTDKEIRTSRTLRSTWDLALMVHFPLAMTSRNFSTHLQ